MQAKNAGASNHQRIILACLVLTLLGLGIHTYMERERYTSVQIYNPRIPEHTIFGHVHMPKTYGTTINGEMALRFRNVCGNKGYSLLEYQRNVNLQAFKVGKRVSPIFGNSSHVDLMRVLQKHFNTSIQAVNSAVGYEECDYISQEASWDFWPSLFKNSSVKMELHVPCRDKLEHLMSMCNFKHIHFDCEKDIEEMSKKCLIGLNRFSDMLVIQYPNIKVRCFSPEKLDQYYRLMEKYLLPRKMTVPYVFRPSNKPRKRSTECIWTNHTASSLAIEYLKRLVYYKFCELCIGSADDLLLTAL